MTTDVNSLALDMLTFSGPLRIIRQPQGAENYEARAKHLLSSPAAEDVEEIRAWVVVSSISGPGRTAKTGPTRRCCERRIRVKVTVSAYL